MSRLFWKFTRCCFQESRIQITNWDNKTLWRIVLTQFDLALRMDSSQTFWRETRYTSEALMKHRRILNWPVTQPSCQASCQLCIASRATTSWPLLEVEEAPTLTQQTALDMDPEAVLIIWVESINRIIPHNRKHLLERWVHWIKDLIKTLKIWVFPPFIDHFMSWEFQFISYIKYN